MPDNMSSDDGAIEERTDRATALREAIYAHTEAYSPDTTILVLSHHLTRLRGEAEQAQMDARYEGDN